jgi:hypothetical protein
MNKNEINEKGKSIPATGHEMSRLLHFVDNRLTDGGEVVSLTSRLPFNSKKISGTDF